MQPYYRQDGITIYHGDCLEVLPALSADVVITDPPYNLGLAYGASVNDLRDDYESWCKQVLRLCRASAPAVALTPGIANLGLWMSIEPPRWTLCWLKPAAMGRSYLGFNNWEPVLLWGKPRRRDGVDVFVAPIIPDPEVKGHPCPKPLLWGRRMVGLLSNEGDVILDPFMGTGTTLAAAKWFGRPCALVYQRLANGLAWTQSVSR